MTWVKTALVHRLDEELSGIDIADCDVPPPSSSEVQVRIKTLALNFPDLLMCSGGYQFKPPLPFALGMEAAGVITAVGAEVKHWSAGDEVIVGARSGLSVQLVNVAPSQLSAKPRAMTWESAAAWRVAWMTALTALQPIGKLEKGQSLLVLGAGSGVGYAAVDVGVKLGARVFATGSSEEKRALAQSAGAAQVFAPDETLPAQIKEATEGKGVALVYDPVGGDAFHYGLRCLRWGGKMLVIGFASGERPTLAVNYALIKGLSVIGVRAGEFARQDPQAGAKVQKQLLAWAEAGLITPAIGARFKLEEIKEGLQLMKNRGALGKIVITL